jgi:hypothetical protein
LYYANVDGNTVVNDADVTRLTDYFAGLATLNCAEPTSATPTRQETPSTPPVTPTSVCGNNVLEVGEECDGAIVPSGYICSYVCRRQAIPQSSTQPEARKCGDTNNDGNRTGADVTYLVRYLKQLGPAPAPLYYANVDGNSVVDNSDVTRLVDYFTGEATLDCAEPAPPQQIQPTARQCGDTNNDGNRTGADVTYLVRYLNDNGPAPAPLYYANVDGNSVVDDADVTRLVDYFNGEARLNCVEPAPLQQTQPTARRCGDTNNDKNLTGADVTYLVRYLNDNGPAPTPLYYANVDGNSVVDDADVTRLVDYFAGRVTTLVCVQPTHTSIRSQQPGVTSTIQTTRTQQATDTCRISFFGWFCLIR